MCLQDTLVVGQSAAHELARAQLGLNSRQRHLSYKGVPLALKKRNLFVLYQSLLAAATLFALLYSSGSAYASTRLWLEIC
jgi:hypothetical protein